MPIRIIAIVILIVAVGTAVLAAIGWPASSYRHNDFAGFWVGSRLLLDGVDPYQFGPFLEMHQRIGSQGLAINPPGTAYGYPLTAAMVFAPFALLPVELAAPLWFVTQATLATGAIIALALVLVRETFRRDLPVLVAVGASSQPAWLLAAGGNLGGYLLAIAAASTALVLRERPFLAGAVLGFLVVKPHPLLIAVPLMLLGLPRATAARVVGGAAVVGGAIVLASVLIQPGWIAEYLVPLGRIGGAPVRRSTVFGLVGPELGPLTWVVVALILGTFVVWELRRVRRTELLVAAAIPVSLFCVPYGWSYDQLLLLVTATVIVAIVARATTRARFVVVATLAIVLVPLTWTLYGIAFQRGEESWTAVVPVAMLGLLAVAERAARGRTQADVLT